MNDSARAAASSAASLTYLKTAIENFADENLADGIKTLADIINSMDPNTVNRIFKGIALGVGGLIAYSAGAKNFRACAACSVQAVRPDKRAGCWVVGVIPP